MPGHSSLAWGSGSQPLPGQAGLFCVPRERALGWDGRCRLSCGQAGSPRPCCQQRQAGSGLGSAACHGPAVCRAANKLEPAETGLGPAQLSSRQATGTNAPPAPHRAPAPAAVVQSPQAAGRLWGAPTTARCPHLLSGPEQGAGAELSASGAPSPQPPRVPLHQPAQPWDHPRLRGAPATVRKMQETGRRGGLGPCRPSGDRSPVYEGRRQRHGQSHGAGVPVPSPRAHPSSAHAALSYGRGPGAPSHLPRSTQAPAPALPPQSNFSSTEGT